jgi:Putative peptidoglycan binding domain
MYFYQNKNKMKSVLFVLISIFIQFSAFTQNNVCKAVCTTDPVIVEEEKIHYIFTGSDTTGLNVKSTKITIMEGRKELVKRRKSGDCLSPNPADCLVEVLEEIPPVSMNLYTLPNIEKTKEYDIRKEKIRIVKSEGAQSEESVVCPKNRSPKLIKKVQTALIKLGYPIVQNGILDPATNLSITDFQKSKGLPYGDLTLSTLSALGVK